MNDAIVDFYNHMENHNMSLDEADEILNKYLLNAYVVSTPECFAMGKYVPENFTKLNCFDHDEFFDISNFFFIFFFSGNIQEAINFIPKLEAENFIFYRSKHDKLKCFKAEDIKRAGRHIRQLPAPN